MDSVLTYQQGNQWQRDRYSFMSEYNRQMGIKEFAPAPGKEQPYYHILKPKDSLHNFLGESEILQTVEARFGQHKAGDELRVMTNTVASQPCCFNLFAPIKNRMDLAGRLFSELLGKSVAVQHIEIEFTPNSHSYLAGFELSEDESLGDQGAKRGTDADVAVFYTYGKQKGVVLIEFKYIESEFSQCGSFKNDIDKKFRNICDNQGYYKTLIEPNLEKKSGRFNCGYLKYFNWKLKSKVFDNKAIENSNGCPFRFSIQQLWRNLLLAENVARARKLDEFFFWVLSPAENTFLWSENGKNVETELRNILTPFGNSIFRRLELDRDFFQVLKPLIYDDWMKRWANKFWERYLTVTSIE
jgi:hypothetical protein